MTKLDFCQFYFILHTSILCVTLIEFIAVLPIIFEGLTVKIYTFLRDEEKHVGKKYVFFILHSFSFIFTVCKKGTKLNFFHTIPLSRQNI